MSDELCELLPHLCKLSFSLGKSATAAAAHAKELELVNVGANPPEQPLDLSLALHASEYPRGA